MSGLPTDKLIQCFEDNQHLCVKVLDGSANIMSFNPYGLKLMEIDDPAKVIGKAWVDLWPKETQPEVLAALAETKKGRAGYFQGSCATLRGTTKYWDVTVAPLFDEFGSVLWLLVLSKDITSTHNLQEQLDDKDATIAHLTAQLTSASS